MRTNTFCIGLILLVSMLTTACTKEPLTPLDTALNQVMGYGSVDAHFCTSLPAPAKQNIKYLFIVDHSAWNQPIANCNPAVTSCSLMSVNADPAGVDPNGFLRYGPVVNFVNSLVPDPNNLTSFGLIDFSDAALQPQNQTGFDSSASDFVTNVLNNDWIGTGSQQNPTPKDGGFTNYQAALQMAYSLIQTDAQDEAISNSQPIITTTYVVIFISEGLPTVVNGATTYTQTFSTDISPVLTSIMGLKSDPTLGPYINNITVNTAYYYDPVNEAPNASAEGLLQQMATAGNGQYIQFGSGQNVLYQQFTPPSRNVVNQLADVFVQNMNSVWWDGQFMADSDGDGLPDLIEMQLGSNPYLADSDGNGVNDFVEYQTKGKPCNDSACAAVNRDQYAICAGYSPKTLNGTVTFSSTANDGLNDCEKFLLGGQVGLYNSNGDLIPDFFAIVNTLPIINGTANSAFADPFGDGVTNYAKLKLGLPIQVSDRTLTGFSTRLTEMVVESQPSPQVTCYHLQVAQVALAATSVNMIKVMVVQNGSSIFDKPFLQVAEGAIGVNSIATFQSTDFH